jgi:hypothetical protein
VTARKAGTQSLAQIFAVPTALGAITAIGLIAALVGDGIWDVVGWLSLGVPVVVIVWFLLLRPRPAK